MVAVGSLKKVWTGFPPDYSEGEFAHAFRDFFAFEWSEVVNAVDMSFAYNSYNNAYFSVENIEPVENLNLDQLLECSGLHRPPNVVAS